jgi:CRP/FNR family transcriptional regulator, anaerobic regulatory protein
MEIITSINTTHRPIHTRRAIDHQLTEVRQFGVSGLMANSESCAQMRDMASSKNVTAGETLFWEDDATEYAYFLTDGTMKAYKLLPNGRSQIVRFIAVSEIIASTCFNAHTYTTEALGDCTVLQLPKRRFDKLLADDPMLMQSVTNKLSLELQQVQKQVLLLGRMPAIERVSNFLLDIAERQNPETVEFEPGFIIDLPMARIDIADYLGLTIETVSRAFSKFRRDGLIDLPRPNLVRLRDQTGLQQQSSLQTI